MIIRHDAKEIARGEGELLIQDPTKLVTLALPIPQLVIPSPGYLHFKVILSKGPAVIFEQETERPFSVNRP